MITLDVPVDVSTDVHVSTDHRHHVVTVEPVTDDNAVTLDIL